VLLEATDDGTARLPVNSCSRPDTPAADRSGIVETALQRSLEEGELGQGIDRRGTLIYLPCYAEAEQTVAGPDQALCSAPSNYPSILFEKASEWYAQKTGKSLAPPRKA